MTFREEQSSEFIQIRDLVERLINEQHGSGARVATEQTVPQVSPAEELKKYHDLLVAGAITNAEFQDIKSKILKL